MKLWQCIVAAPLMLGACTDIVSESSRTIVVDGSSFEVRTRVIDGPNGRYEATDALVGRVSYPCRPDSPGDCEAAVRRGLNRFDGGD